MCMLSILAGLFGCNKKSEIPTEYPFDKEKAYLYSRQGVMAGGNFHLSLNPRDVVEYYSYTKAVPEDECGMRDKGADIYFVGLKEGSVQVTAVFEYPTCEPHEYTFTLDVNKDLYVSKPD